MIVGGRNCVKGFDWSVWQAPRDLTGAVREGHRFAVIKASEGNAVADRNYALHAANVCAAGLLCGAYHFARPSGAGAVDGQAEARYFLSRIDNRTDFVVLDLETSELGPTETTQYVLGFMDELIRSGRFPAREQRVLYVGHYFNWQHAVAVAQRCVLWVPAYTVNYADPDPTRIPLPLWCKDLWPEGWAIWQYTSSGTVAGLHPSDMNVATVEWLDSVATRVSRPPQPYSGIGEWQMRPVAIAGENAQYEIVLDGNGNRRRRGIGTQAEAVVLAKAGVIAGQDQLLVLEDPAEIDAFRAIPEVGLGGPPVLADVGALKLAVETWNRVEGLKALMVAGSEARPEPADRQALVDAVRRIGQEIGGVADQLDK